MKSFKAAKGKEQFRKKIKTNTTAGLTEQQFVNIEKLLSCHSPAYVLKTLLDTIESNRRKKIVEDQIADEARLGYNFCSVAPCEEDMQRKISLMYDDDNPPTKPSILRKHERKAVKPKQGCIRFNPDTELNAMDPEKSSHSSFEDLSKEELEVDDQISGDTGSKTDTTKEDDGVIDIIGNGQLVKRIITKGLTEERPNRSDLCVVNYTGKLEDGTVVENVRNFTIQVGDIEVVQGLDMAIPLMSIGECAEISVDSRFAYGKIGLKREGEPSIPPSAKIVYEVELVSSKVEDDLEMLSFAKRKEIGNKKRERGNFWFDQKEYNLAIQLYRRALEYLDETEGGITDPTEDGELPPTNSQLQELLEDRVRVYNNLAMAQMKISAFEAALKSVEMVLRCQPNNVKALFRKGKILDAKNDTNDAIPVLQKAAILDPESKAIQQMLSKLILKQRREARNEKDLYQKMLGQAQALENKKKSINLNKDGKLKLWGYLMGSILVGVAGVAMYRYKYF